jgi:hypothetical protein
MQAPLESGDHTVLNLDKSALLSFPSIQWLRDQRLRLSYTQDTVYIIATGSAVLV